MYILISIILFDKITSLDLHTFQQNLYLNFVHWEQYFPPLDLYRWKSKELKKKQQIITYAAILLSLSSIKLGWDQSLIICYNIW